MALGRLPWSRLLFCVLVLLPGLRAACQEHTAADQELVRHFRAGREDMQSGRFDHAVEQFKEVLRLRGEVGRLQAAVQELARAKTNEPLSREEVLASMRQLYLDRVNGLKQLFAANPDEGVPELQYLTDRDWRPLAGLLAARLVHLNPPQDIVFLTRVAAMAPGIYHMSKLLDQMQGRTRVTTILFYPGSIEGTTGLRFILSAAAARHRSPRAGSTPQARPARSTRRCLRLSRGSTRRAIQPP